MAAIGLISESIPRPLDLASESKRQTNRSEVDARNSECGNELLKLWLTRFLRDHDNESLTHTRKCACEELVNAKNRAFISQCFFFVDNKILPRFLQQ